MHCSQCGSKYKEGALSCSQCGEALAPASTRLAQVTVLSAQVSGLSTLAGCLSPEDAVEVTGRLWVSLEGAITTYGGHTLERTASSVTAWWGSPRVREEDPENALLAAQAMLQELGVIKWDIAGKLENDGPVSGTVELSLQVGLHTGQAAINPAGAAAQLAPLPAALEEAARLGQAASPGSIWLSAAAYQHLLGLYDFQPQSLPESEPHAAYQFVRPRPRLLRMTPRRVQGIKTSLVGRADELQQLCQAFESVRADRRLQMVTVWGETGIGKSRLLFDFDCWVDQYPDRVWYFRGRAVPEMQSQPYALLRDLFIARFELRDSDPPEAVRQKFERGIIYAPQAPGVEPSPEELPVSDVHQVLRAHVIGHLLGFDFSHSPYLENLLHNAHQLRERAQVYLADFFRLHAQSGPVLVQFEDLQWADDSSLDLIDHLTLSLAHERVMIVGAARSPLFRRRPAWGKKHHLQYRMYLPPLSETATRQLVREILRLAPDVPDSLCDQIASSAEGNPYYIEELVKMLVDCGVIDTGGETWRIVPECLTTVRIPATLAAVVQARLDALLPAERETLQRAAVVGRIFWDRAVGYLAGRAQGAISPEISRSLAVLRQHEMIFRHSTSAFAGAEEFIFKNSVMRKVVYESMPRRVRRQYHALAAAWLLSESGERSDEVVGLIAGHLEEAGEKERALAFLQRAASLALARFANSAAEDYCSRALALASPNAPQQRWELLLIREKALSLQAQRLPQEADIKALSLLALELANPAYQAEVSLRRASYAHGLSDFSAWAASAQEARALAAVAGERGLEAEAYAEWGSALLRQGEYRQARLRLEHALKLAATVGRDSRARRVEVGCLLELGTAAWHWGDYPQAQADYEQALEIARQIGDRYAEANILNNLGSLYRNLVDFAQALLHCEQSLTISRETGDVYSEGITLSNLGIISSDQGDYDRAQAYYEQALQIMRAVVNRRGEAGVLNSLGVVASCRGEYTQARDYFESARAIFLQIGDRRILGYVLTGLGDALMHLGDYDQARRLLEEALELRHELGQAHLALETRAALARLYLGLQDFPAALAHVHEILRQQAAVGTLADLTSPMRVCLTCYLVLSAAPDAESHRRAWLLLINTHRRLQVLAAGLDEPARQMFLENIPWHRLILAAWEQASQSGDQP